MIKKLIKRLVEKFIIWYCEKNGIGLFAKYEMVEDIDVLGWIGAMIELAVENKDQKKYKEMCKKRYNHWVRISRKYDTCYKPNLKYRYKHQEIIEQRDLSRSSI